MSHQKESSKQSEEQSKKSWTKPAGARGTAAMDPETRRRVASLGGQKVSRDKAHMAEMGRKGGRAASADRAHMAAIGRIGGSNSRKGARG